MINLKENAFFFDFDGTLIDLVPNYKNIEVPNYLADLINHLYIKCEGALAIITGRSITNLLSYLKVSCPIAGLHGVEYLENNIFSAPKITSNFEQAKIYIEKNHPAELRIEDKNLNVAIHYKEHQNTKETAIKLCKETMQKFNLKNYEIQLSRQVVELKLKNFNKATALKHFMSQPSFANRFPVCFGDDITDEDMFEAALSYNGKAFSVGESSRVNFKQNWPNIESSSKLRAYLQHLIQEKK